MSAAKIRLTNHNKNEKLKDGRFTRNKHTQQLQGLHGVGTRLSPQQATEQLQSPVHYFKKKRLSSVEIICDSKEEHMMEAVKLIKKQGKSMVRFYVS